MDCRGNRAACASTDEKSRHLRQSAPEGIALGFGLDACNCVKSGLDASGIGGGTPSVAGVELGLPMGTSGGGGGIAAVLLNPKSNADRFGLLIGAGAMAPS